MATTDLLEARGSLVAALLSNDADVIAPFFDESWIAIHPDGAMTREKLIRAVRSGDLRHETFDDVGETRVFGDGDHAIRTTRVRSSGSVAGVHYEADEWVTDVVRFDGSQWRCVFSQKTPVA